LYNGCFCHRLPATAPPSAPPPYSVATAPGSSAPLPQCKVFIPSFRHACISSFRSSFRSSFISPLELPLDLPSFLPVDLPSFFPVCLLHFPLFLSVHFFL
jgi:hypothetical protein